MPVINTYGFYQRSSVYAGLPAPTYTDRYRSTPGVEVLTGSVTTHTFTPYQSNTNGSVANPDYDKYFFGRVYGVLPTINNFGLVSGLIQETLIFWNAAFTNSKVSNLREEGAQETALTGLASGQTLAPQEEIAPVFTIPEDAEGFIDGYYEVEFTNATVVVDTYRYEFFAQKLEIWPDVDRTLEPNWSYGVDERFELQTEIITSESNNEQRIAKRAYPRHYITGTFMIPEDLTPTFRMMMIKSDQQFLIPYWMDPHYIVNNTAAGASNFTLDSPIENLEDGDYILYESPSGLTARQAISQNGTDLQLGSSTGQDIPANARIWKAFYGRLNPETQYSRLTGTVSEVLLQFDVQNETGKLLPEPFAINEDTYQGLPVLLRRADWAQAQNAREFFKSDKLELGPNNRAYFYKWEESQRTEQIDFINYDKAHAKQLRDFFLNRRGRQLTFWRPSLVPDMRLFDDTGDRNGTSIRVTPPQLSKAYREGSSLYRNVMILYTDGERRYFEIEAVSDGAEYATVTFTETLGRDTLQSNVDRICWLYYVRFANDDFTITHDTTKVSNVSLAVTTVKNRVGE